MTAQSQESNTSGEISTDIAVVYLRVSTEEQGKKGFSIEAQRKIALDYIDDHNNKVKEKILKGNYLYAPDELIVKEIKPASKVFKEESIDEDLFSSLTSRPILKQLLEMAQRREFKHIIVYSRDRLTRNFEQFIALKYFLKKNNIQIHYTRPGESLNVEDNKINRFLDNILASVAELEANTIGIRVKSGCIQCVKKGNWPGGTPPYGYVLKSEKIKGRSHHISKLQPSTYEKIRVLEVFELYGKGYGYRRIAKIMNEKYDDPIWTKSKVEKILKNETYTGKITWNRRGGRRHPNEKGALVQSSQIEGIQFIDSHYWDESVKLREKKAALKDSNYYDTSYLLKGKLVCDKCDKKLKTKNYGKGSVVYRCPTISGTRSELTLDKTKIETLVLEKINHHLNSYNLSKLWESYKARKDKYVSKEAPSIEKLRTDIIEIEKLQQNLKSLVSNLNVEEDIEFKIALRDKLNAEDLNLIKVKAQHEEKIEEYKNFINSFFSNEEEYLKSLEKYKIDINALSLRDQRLFIDILIDEIVVNKNDESLDINIIFSPPKEV